MRKTPLDKKRYTFKVKDCLRAIDTGNAKIFDTMYTLEPMLTTRELQQIHKNLVGIMHLQCEAFAIMLSEKEEEI